MRKDKLKNPVTVYPEFRSSDRERSLLVDLLKSELAVPMTEIQYHRTVADYLQIYYSLPEVVIRSKQSDEPIFHKRIPDRETRTRSLRLIETDSLCLEIRQSAGVSKDADQELHSVVESARSPARLVPGLSKTRIGVQYVSPLLLSDTAWKTEIFSLYMEELRRLILFHLPEGHGLSRFAVSILFREEQGFGYLFSVNQERELIGKENSVKQYILRDARLRFGKTRAFESVRKRLDEIRIPDLLQNYRWTRTRGIISRIGSTALSWYIENYFEHEWRGSLVGDFYIISLAEYFLLDEGNVWYGIPIFWRSHSYDPSPKTLIGALQFVGPNSLPSLPPIARVQILNVFSRKLNELHVAVDSAKVFYDFELKEKQLRSNLETRARFSVTFFRNFRHLISGKLPIWIHALEKIGGEQARDALLSMKKIDLYFRSRQDLRKLDLKIVDVDGFLELYEKEKKQKLSGKACRLTVDCSAIHKKAKVLIIENELHDILDQLLDNSLEQFETCAPRSATRELDIRIVSSICNNSVFLEFQDNAGGFSGTDSQEPIDQIFEDYYTTRGPGRGIGLTLCRDMAGTYGGTLFASNRFVNRIKTGAVFVLQFPLSS